MKRIGRERRGSRNFRAFVVGVAAWAAASAVWAQAGSTGGVIPNADKSASGVKQKYRPPPHVLPRTPRRRAEPAVAPVAKLPEPAVDGRWRWSGKCVDGTNPHGEFSLETTAPGEFKGKFNISRIQDGRVAGGAISFTRNLILFRQAWKGRIAAGHMSGEITGPVDCTWLADKV